MRNNLMIAMAAISFAGCTVNVEKPKSENKTHVGYSGYSLQTIEHDGHMFVVNIGNEKAAIIHHPGCKCLKIDWQNAVLTKGSK